VPQSQYMFYSDANILSEHVNNSTTWNCTKTVLRFQPQRKEKTNLMIPNNGDNSYPLAPSCWNCFILCILLVVYLITLLAAQAIKQQTDFDLWIKNWKIHGRKKSRTHLTRYVRIYLEQQRKNQTRHLWNYKLDALLLELIQSILHNTNAKTCLWLIWCL